MNKQKTTLNLDKDLMKLLKLKALELDLTQTELITLYLKYGLSNHNRIKKIITEKNYNRYKLKRLDK